MRRLWCYKTRRSTGKIEFDSRTKEMKIEEDKKSWFVCLAALHMAEQAHILHISSFFKASNSQGKVSQRCELSPVHLVKQAVGEEASLSINKKTQSVQACRTTITSCNVNQDCRAWASIRDAAETNCTRQKDETQGKRPFSFQGEVSVQTPQSYIYFL